MNELINFKGMWNQAVNFWRGNLLAVILCAVSFAFGVAVGTKTIVDDCKFSKVFRDGPTVYECQQRFR